LEGYNADSQEEEPLNAVHTEAKNRYFP